MIVYRTITDRPAARRHAFRDHGAERAYCGRRPSGTAQALIPTVFPPICQQCIAAQKKAAAPRPKRTRRK